MAYVSTTGIAANTAELYTALKTFLTTTAGWTLHDDVAQTNPYFVAYSPGESGRERIYLRYYDISTANQLCVAAFQYWNATTHAGVHGATNGDTSNPFIITSDTASFIYWIYADLDHVIIVTKIVSTYYIQYSGIIDRLWSSSIATSQASIAAGSNVVVPVDDASIFTVGRKYVIIDNANVELATVSAVDTGATPDTVTFATVTKSYSSGAQIGEDPRPVGSWRCDSIAGFFINGVAGWSSTSGQYYVSERIQTTMSYADPDARFGLTLLIPFPVICQTAGAQETRGSLTGVYAVGGDNTASEDTITVGSDTYTVFKTNWWGALAVKNG